MWSAFHRADRGVRYLSVCSGIEAATVAWHPLGWEAAAFSEIEAFPRAVLSHHYPDVPLHGDFTMIGADQYGAIDLLVGGTPCQSFSVAGLRGGMDDERGQLALQFLKLLDRTRARWVVWENVPGVLSSNGGRDFGSLLGGLVELGYGFAYRILDAQFFGVPQRRRRVFVVGHLGDWRCAAAVLFERHSLSGHPAPRREAREGTASRASCGFEVGGTLGPRVSRLTTDECANGAAIVAHCENVSRSLTACKTATGRLDPNEQEFIAFTAKDHGADASDISPTLRSGSHSGSHANGGVMPAVAFTASEQANSYAWERDVYPTLNAQVPNDSSNIQQGIRQGSAVRRLTPRECERLQGFPDDYTLISYRGKTAADGPRYKALGNSMAVPVMRWIGERIAAVEALAAESLAA
jgi:DNA (cytosine-5)-methyltransferase 1